jgi:hypothetical protein
MDQQSRPLETMPSCLEAELLRAALTEVAPSATRARVLQAIDAALTRPSSAHPDLLAGSANSRKVSAPCAPAATSSAAVLSVGIPIDDITPARVVPRQVCPPPLRGRFRRLLPAIQLAAAVVVGVGTAAGARALRSRELVVPPTASSGTLGATSTVLTNNSGRRLDVPAPINDEARRPGVPRLAPKQAPAPTEEPPDDWLGAQLSILSQADRSLREGKSEEALKSLDKYATSFPMGLLDPQVAMLRQRAELGGERQVFILP